MDSVGDGAGGTQSTCTRAVCLGLIFNLETSSGVS